MRLLRRDPLRGTDAAVLRHLVQELNLQFTPEVGVRAWGEMYKLSVTQMSGNKLLVTLKREECIVAEISVDPSLPRGKVLSMQQPRNRWLRRR